MYDNKQSLHLSATQIFIQKFSVAVCGVAL